MNKRKAIIITSSVVLLGVTGGVAANMAGSKTVGAGTSPLISEVDQHEVRITNAENNIRSLQTATNTPDNPSNAPVPTVTAPSTTTTNSVTSNTVVADTSQITTEPITIVSYKKIPVDANNTDCEYTYSDGTTHRFNWQVFKEHGSWVTDGNGENGHWVALSATYGVCDDSVIGTVKP